MPVEPYGGIQQGNIKRWKKISILQTHIRQSDTITNQNKHDHSLTSTWTLPSILGTRNNRNAGSETRTINRLSLVNHEQDWAAISDRGDTDIHDIATNWAWALIAYGLFNATNASLNLNFALGLTPAENAIAKDGAYDLGVDFVDMFGWFHDHRSTGTNRKRKFSRFENQPSFACVCNGDRNSDRESLEVLEGACVAI